MKMVKNVCLLILLSALCMSVAYADGTFYLVRHAEKQNDGTKDPHLTDQGQKRAGYLAQQLSLANITKIYSTNYHRTQETAKPLSDLLGISVEPYNPGKLEEFAETLKAETGNIVIVGHSNTTPNLAAFLSGEDVAGIDESEYENLYQIVLLGGKTKLTRFKIFPIDLTSSKPDS
jgi:broad specificity phosphatase PhoE